MDTLQALAVTCKHLHYELPSTLTRLQKQKAAAHTRAYRLRRRVAKLELANKMILAMWMTVRRHNELMQMEIDHYVQELKRNDIE